jgi:hypothetical protein
MKTQLISPDVKKHLQLFVKYYKTNTLPYLVENVLNNSIDYQKELLKKNIQVSTIYSVYLNNLKVNSSGMVLNHTQAMTRAAQKIRSILDSNYKANPKF